MKCKNFFCANFDVTQSKSCIEYIFVPIDGCKQRKLFNKLFNKLFLSKVNTIDYAYELYKEGKL